MPDVRAYTLVSFRNKGCISAQCNTSRFYLDTHFLLGSKALIMMSCASSKALLVPYAPCGA
eukprot:5019884-Amphidinium_carterae.1